MAWGFVGEMSGMSCIAFLASGIIASSAMTTASFEGMYSVFTRMVPQKTYEAILATPLEIDDILAGVFYPIESLPAGVQGAVQFLPLTHAVILTRGLVAVAELPQPLLHLAVLLLCAIVSYAIALVLVRRRLQL